MDAYEILSRLNATDQIGETCFHELKREFQAAFLKDFQYEERLSFHRNPVEVKNEILNELNRRLQAIQQRQEMQDIDLIKNSAGHVPTKVVELWQSDKRLRSCYNAVVKYSIIRSKNFNEIAVHMAEYKALCKLFITIQRSKFEKKQL